MLQTGCLQILLNLLLQLADNARLVKTVGDGRVLLNSFAIRCREHDAAQLEQIYQYHRGVVGTVIQRDAIEARRILGEHIRLSKQKRLREYDDAQRERAMDRASSSWNVLPELDVTG